MSGGFLCAVVRVLKEITEVEMIAVFLRAEITSSRFSRGILGILQRDHVNRKIIDNPNVNSSAENEYRIALLGEFRGYKRNEELFTDFPDDVRWYRVLLNQSDLLRAKYMNYSYWIDLSGGSRLVSDAVERIVKGEIEKETADWARAAADGVKQGLRFEEIILVSRNQESALITLEGHLRITAYLLSIDHLSSEIPAIIGYSERIVEWDES